MTDEELKEQILTANTLYFNWKKVLEGYSVLADLCNIGLCMCQYFFQFRVKEKREDRGVLSSSVEVKKKWNQYFFDQLKNYPGDKFFYPGEFRDANKKVKYFDNYLASVYFDKMVIFNALPQSVQELRMYSMTLKKFFRLLSTEKEPPLQTISFLIHWLMQIWTQKEKYLRKMEEKESESKEMGKRGTIKKERALKKIREHEWYSRLGKKYKKIKLLDAQGDKKEIDRINKQIDNLIEKISDTDNKGTIRSYRNALHKDFDI